MGYDYQNFDFSTDGLIQYYNENPEYIGGEKKERGFIKEIIREVQIIKHNVYEGLIYPMVII